MSLAQGFAWTYQDLQFTGYSLAGITTSLYFRNANVCFDVGQGLPFQVPAKRILITHAHSDHASGIHYLLSQKAIQGLEGTEIYVPTRMESPLGKILELWREMEEFGYEYKLAAAEPGKLYALDNLYVMKPFATVHRVQSQGYLVYRKRKRLREDLRAGGEAAIRAARARGEDPNERFLEPLVAFTGDTQIEFIDANPEVSRAKVLFMEVTFWDEKRSVESTRKWGHIHFEEFLAALPKLANERIVLIHASVRYSSEYLRRLLAERLPEAERTRVELFPRAY